MVLHIPKPVNGDDSQRQDTSRSVTEGDSSTETGRQPPRLSPLVISKNKESTARSGSQSVCLNTTDKPNTRADTRDGDLSEDRRVETSVFTVPGDPCTSLCPAYESSNATGLNESEQSLVANKDMTARGPLKANELSPVLRRKGSSQNKPQRDVNKSFSASRTSEVGTSTMKENPNNPAPSSTTSDSLGPPDAGTAAACPTETCTPSAPVVSKRRISFVADSVLTAVIQDRDTAELMRILTGRHGPGLAVVPSHSKGEKGRGVDVRQTNHLGLTALHHAVLADNLDAAKLLLCHGADVNAQDVHGFSPLHTAAACGSLPLTSLFLLFGADVFSLTLEHELPVDVAKELSIVRMLTGEMTRLVHQELWVTAALRTHAADLWLLVRKVIACVLLFVLYVVTCVRAAWGRRREKSD